MNKILVYWYSLYVGLSYYSAMQLIFFLILQFAVALNADSPAVVHPVKKLECQLVSHYNAMCIHDDVAYFMTSLPCKSQLDFIVTIVEPLDNSYKKYEVNKRLIHTTGKNRVEFTASYFPKGQYAGNTRAAIYLYHGQSPFADVMFEVYFFTASNGKELCDKLNLYDRGTSFTTKNCIKVIELDKFGTICYYKVSDNATGLYTTLFDPCTVPYNVMVGSYIPVMKSMVVDVYTGSKTDQIVPVNNSTGCGFKLEYKSRKNSHGDEQWVILWHICPNKEKDKLQMINSFYQSHDGYMCHPSDCTKISPGHVNCTTEIIGPDKMETFMKFDLKADLCNGEKIDVIITIPGKTGTVNKTLTSHDDTIPFIFDAHSMPNVLPANVTNGTIPHEGGLLSFELKHFPNENVLRLSLFRHYPTMDDHIPLVHARYSTNIEHCTSKHSSRHAVIAAVVIIAVIICILVVVIIFFKQRRKTQTRGDGLPYHMEVNTFEDEDDYLK